MSYKRLLRIFSAACLLGLVTSALQFTPIAASGGSITLSPSSGTCGTTVTVTGTNWLPVQGVYDHVVLWETPYDHGIGQIPYKMSTITADASGHFEFSTPMPPASDTRICSSYVVTAILSGEASGPSQTFFATDSGGGEPPPTTTTESASMNINPASGPPGTPITITGSGFGPAGTTVTITPTWGIPTTVNTTNSSGYFATLLVVPTVGLTSPTCSITATAGSNIVTRYFTVTPTTIFNLSSYTGYTGDSVIVTGTGFTPGTAISFFLDSTQTALASLIPMTDGTLTGSITIPAATRGNHTILTSVSGVPTQQFAVNSKIIVSPVTGGAGDIVSIAGSGFDAGPPNIVTISLDDVSLTTSPATVNSDASGSFSCVFTIPSVTQGNHMLKATDNGGSATASLSIAPKMTLTPSSGFVGDKDGGIGNDGAGYGHSLLFTAGHLAGVVIHSVG